MNNELEYAPDEKPRYAYCESQWAGPKSRWHIRFINPTIGLKLGGGIDTGSLCGHVKPKWGWDLSVRVSDKHKENTCTECYDQLILYKSMMEP